MVRFTQPQSWTSDPHDLYVAIAENGNVVGLVKPTHAPQLLAMLNDTQLVRKALKLACTDLAAATGGSPGQVAALMEQYLNKAQRPTKGVAAIALYLQERQRELDLTDDEFIKFCDTFRLSAAELNRIQNHEEIEYKQLNSLARILGLSVDELLRIWKEEP